jgi:hypothetical protein
MRDAGHNYLSTGNILKLKMIVFKKKYIRSKVFSLRNTESKIESGKRKRQERQYERNIGLQGKDIK